MDEREFIDLLNRLARHNRAVERLLDDERGQRELLRFVDNELALLGFLLETSGDDPQTEPARPDETPDEKKRRLGDKAKEWLRRNGKDIAKELLLKLNNILTGAIPGLKP